MKKQFCVLCVSALLFLSACTPQPATSALVQSNAVSKADANLPPLRFVTSDFEFSTKGNGNENGYYYIDRGGTLAANLRYIDYATQQDIFLSAHPEGNHYVPEDESYISSVAGCGVTFPVGNALFLVRTGAPDYANQLGNDALAAIYRMELNGADRKLLYTGGANEMLLSTIATDGKNLFFIRNQTELKENIPIQSRFLVQLDTTTGEQKEICALPDGAWMIGASGQSLIFHSITVKNKAENAAPRMEHEIFAYSLETQNLSTVQSWSSAENKTALVFQNNCITVNADTKELTVTEISTGKIIATHSLAQFMTAENKNIWFQGCHDNHFYFFDWSVQQLCAIDLVSGEGKYITMTYLDPDKQEQRPVEIYAETDTDFLICYDKKILPRNYPAPDGTMETIEVSQPQFALIAKADYWNSVANYKQVTLHE